MVLPTHSHSSPSAMSTLPFPHACVAWQRPFANEFNVSMQITLTREDEWRKMHQVEYRHSYSRVYLLTAGAFKQAKSPSTSPQTERLSAASLQIVPSGSQATLRWLKLQFSKSRHSLGCGNGGGGAREQRKQALAPPTKKRSRASRIFGGNKQESCITINVLLFQSQRQKKNEFNATYPPSVAHFTLQLLFA